MHLDRDCSWICSTAELVVGVALLPSAAVLSMLGNAMTMLQQLVITLSTMPRTKALSTDARQRTSLVPACVWWQRHGGCVYQTGSATLDLTSAACCQTFRNPGCVSTEHYLHHQGGRAGSALTGRRHAVLVARFWFAIQQTPFRLLMEGSTGCYLPGDVTTVQGIVISPAT